MVGAAACLLPRRA